MRLLFVARRLPHPEARGYQVRAFHQLRLLAPRHRVTLVALGADEASREDVERVAALCERLVDLREVVALALDAEQVVGMGPRPLDGGADAAASGHVVVLDEDAVVEPEAVVRAAARPDGVLVAKGATLEISVSLRLCGRCSVKIVAIHAPRSG